MGEMEPYVQKRSHPFSVVNLVGIAGPVLLFGLLYLIYNFTLNSIVENFFRKVA